MCDVLNKVSNEISIHLCLFLCWPFLLRLPLSSFFSSRSCNHFCFSFCFALEIFVIFALYFFVKYTESLLVFGVIFFFFFRFCCLYRSLFYNWFYGFRLVSRSTWKWMCAVPFMSCSVEFLIAIPFEDSSFLDGMLHTCSNYFFNRQISIASSIKWDKNAYTFILLLYALKWENQHRTIHDENDEKRNKIHLHCIKDSMDYDTIFFVRFE